MATTKGLLVTLEKDVHEDWARQLIAAMKTMRGVLDVREMPSDVNHHVAVMQATAEMQRRLWSVVSESPTMQKSASRAIGPNDPA